MKDHTDGIKQQTLTLCKDMKSINKGCFYRIFTILLWMAVTSVQASFSAPTDSLSTRWIDGKKYYQHKIVSKDTWTRIAKKNNISIKDLQKANGAVSVLKLGQIIMVPAVASGIVEKQIATKENIDVKKQSSIKEIKVFHTVAKGETLYRIAKENSISVDDLKKLNNLSSNNVKLGQKLIIGKTTKSKDQIINDVSPSTHEIHEPVIEKVDESKSIQKKEVKTVAVERATTVKSEPIKPFKVDSPSVYSSLGNSSSSALEKDPKSGVVTEKVKESGLATWISDGELNQNKFYAMHRTAPVGTIIKITNKMNNNSVFVKVVGLLPDTGDNANIIIKITQAAAQRIGALDQRFQAELSYGVTK